MFSKCTESKTASIIGEFSIFHVPLLEIIQTIQFDELSMQFNDIIDIISVC